MGPRSGLVLVSLPDAEQRQGRCGAPQLARDRHRIARRGAPATDQAAASGSYPIAVTETTSTGEETRSPPAIDTSSRVATPARPSAISRSCSSGISAGAPTTT